VLGGAIKDLCGAVAIRSEIARVETKTNVHAGIAFRWFDYISSEIVGVWVETARSVKNCKIKVFSTCFSRLFGAECVYTSNPNQVGAATPTATPIGAHRPLPGGSFLNSFNFDLS
jgi:hypothetical protein